MAYGVWHMMYGDCVVGTDLVGVAHERELISEILDHFLGVGRIATTAGGEVLHIRLQGRC